MKNYYQVLGVAENASAEEIKRAYFRLLRKHSPEKDPQGFKEIREAYENLKDGNTKQGPAFGEFSDSFAEKFEKQIENCLKYGDYERAKETAEEAMRLFPKDLYFAYQAVLAQRKCGNTGKAVKSAELLVEKEPDNPWFAAELATSYWERGYKKKAYPVFERAYELGCRELEFLLDYAYQYNELHEHKKAVKLLLEIIETEKKWKTDELEQVRDAYNGLAMIDASLDLDYNSVLQSYCRFLTEYRIRLGTSIINYLDTMLALVLKTGGTPDLESIYCIRQLFHSIQNTFGSQEMKESIIDIEKSLLTILVSQDQKICRSLQYYSKVLSSGMGEVEKYYLLDACLCMIEERDQILEEESYFRQTYPKLYEEVRDFLEQMRDEKAAQMLKDRLQKEYRRQEPYYEDGHYYEWYPDEKKRAHGTIKASGEETYVRANAKVGRNDPCPCGSGKKFKRCCMGKGIYD